MQNDKEIVDVFISESREILSSFNVNLNTIERDVTDLKPVDEIRRLIHTLKGIFAAMEFPRLTETLHIAEDVLEQIRNTSFFDTETLDIFYELNNKLNSLMNFISYMKINKFGLAENQKIEEMPEFDVSEISNKLHQVSDGKISTGSPYDIVVEFDKNCKLKSARAFQTLARLENLSKIISSKPTRQEIEDEKSFANLKITVISNEDKKLIREQISKVDEITDIKIEKLTEKSIIDKKIEVSSDFQSIRVPLIELNKMMGILSEIVTERNNIEKEFLEKNISSFSFREYDRITNEIQELIINARLVPLDNIFSYYPRLTRKLAQENDKEINLIIRGKGVEIDRISVDLLNEVLIQILRNCIIHGIESPKDRKKKKKPEIGKIVIKAEKDYNDIIIKFEDDGKGIDVLSLKKFAHDKGLIKKKDKLSKDNLLTLLFLSGFTTSDQVSKLAGRGIGLNSVYRTIVDKLKGTVNFETQKDIGTRITLRIRRNQLIFNGLIVEIENLLYSIPIPNISRVMTVPKEKFYFDEQKRPYIVLNREIIPIVTIRENNELESMTQKNMTIYSQGTIIIWQHGDKKFGILVDRLVNQQQTVYKNRDTLMDRIKGFSGFSYLGEGKIAPIIDPTTYGVK
jgi:two-component system chemotaxis sensor kinase CheA